MEFLSPNPVSVSLVSFINNIYSYLKFYNSFFKDVWLQFVCLQATEGHTPNFAFWTMFFSVSLLGWNEQWLTLFWISIWISHLRYCRLVGLDLYPDTSNYLLFWGLVVLGHPKVSEKPCFGLTPVAFFGKRMMSINLLQDAHTPVEISLFKLVCITSGVCQFSAFCWINIHALTKKPWSCQWFVSFLVWMRPILGPG